MQSLGHLEFRLAQYLNALAMGERAVEAARLKLVAHPQFDPVSAFNFIACDRSEYITRQDLRSILKY